MKSHSPIKQIGSSVVTTLDNGTATYDAKNINLFISPYQLSPGVSGSNNIGCQSCNNAYYVLKAGAQTQAPVPVPLSGVINSYIAAVYMTGSATNIKLYRRPYDSNSAVAVNTLTIPTTSGTLAPVTASIAHEIVPQNLYFLEFDNATGKDILRVDGVKVDITIKRAYDDGFTI